MFIRRKTYEATIEALEYSKQQLEYVNSVIGYFDKSHISKSVTEAAIAKNNIALKRLRGIK